MEKVFRAGPRRDTGTILSSIVNKIIICVKFNFKKINISVFKSHDNKSLYHQALPLRS